MIPNYSCGIHDTNENITFVKWTNVIRFESHYLLMQKKKQKQKTEPQQ